MTNEELLAIDSATPPPVFLKDGRMGLLVIYPHGQQKEAGVQVPGEDYHRWINPAELQRHGDALVQDGAPSFEEFEKRFG